MQTIFKLIATGLISLATLFGGHVNQTKTPVLGSTIPVEGTTFVIAQTVLPTDTSITLTSFGTPDGRAFTMTNFGTRGYLTLDPNNSSRLETVTFSGITTNTSSVTLTGVQRGIDFIYPYAPTASLQRTHLVGSQAILSNPAAFYGNEFLFSKTVSTSTALLVFSSTTPPYYDAHPTFTSNTQLVDKQYVDGGVLAGAATSSESTTGISRLATQLQMASSTDTSPNTPLVLYSKYSTSSPTTVCGLCIPITRNDGKLSPNFIATTSADAYNFGGATTFNGGATFTASSTHTATTTIAASSVSSNALILNGLPYKFPSSRAASSTILSEDGSGNLTFEKTVVPRYVLMDNTTLNASSAYATATAQLAIPAGTLNASSTIRFDFATGGACNAGSSGSCNVQLRTSAGVSIFTISAGSDTSGFSTGDAMGEVTVASNNSSTFSSQIYNGHSMDDTGSPTLAVVNNISGTAAIDFSQNQTLKIVIQGSAASFTLDHYSLVVNP